MIDMDIYRAGFPIVIKTPDYFKQLFPAEDNARILGKGRQQEQTLSSVE